MDIAIVLYDGFDELDAIGPFEVFRNAAAKGADLTVTLCTLDGAETVTASHGLDVGADARLDDLDPDLLLVPGGGWNARSEQGAWAEVQQGDLPAAIRRLHESGVAIAAVCTGGMIVEDAGIADGRPANTHHGAVDDLRETEVQVVDARVVDDGDLVTAGGVTSGLDLAFHVVEREFGADIADAVAELMEYEPRGAVHEAA